MKPEIFFLRYAFPCSFVLLLRKEITKKEHKLLYRSTKDEKLYLSRDRIEKIFWRPMRFLKSISDLKSVQKYWRFEHNFYLKKKKFRDFKDVLIDHCLVVPCEVVSVKKNKAIVRSPFLKKKVSLRIDFVKVKPKDKVTKHYDYICERITEKLYQEMVEKLKRL